MVGVAKALPHLYPSALGVHSHLPGPTSISPALPAALLPSLSLGKAVTRAQMGSQGKKTQTTQHYFVVVFFFASETEILTLKTEILCRGNNLGESKPRANQKVRLSAKHTTSASEAQHSPALPFSDRNTNRVFKALNKKLHKYQTPDLYPNKTLHCTHFPLGDGEKTKQTCVGAAGHCSGCCCRKGLCWAVLSPPTASQHSRVCTFVGAHTACLEHIIQG